jgi:uncharacterized protein GlcG (DUF336 family)
MPVVKRGRVGAAPADGSVRRHSTAAVVIAVVEEHGLHLVLEHADKTFKLTEKRKRKLNTKVTVTGLESGFLTLVWRAP